MILQAQFEELSVNIIRNVYFKSLFLIFIWKFVNLNPVQLLIFWVRKKERKKERKKNING